MSYNGHKEKNVADPAEVILSARKRAKDQIERQRVGRWEAACYNYARLLPFFDLALVNWMNHSWSMPAPPDLLATVASWMQMAEMVELIGSATPVEIPEGREEEYAVAGMLTVEALERNVRRFSSYMEVAEERRPQDYESLLIQQLDSLLASFRAAAEMDIEVLLESDEVDFIYGWRDQLAYAVHGIATCSSRATCSGCRA
jgi:hypothetical protein